jgi:hypothetical protein
MRYRVEAHADDLSLLVKKIDNDYRIVYRLIDNQADTEIDYDEAIRIIASEKRARKQQAP